MHSPNTPGGCFSLSWFPHMFYNLNICFPFQLFSRTGFVMKIITFAKPGYPQQFQALIQYMEPKSAQTAKEVCVVLSSCIASFKKPFIHSLLANIILNEYQKCLLRSFILFDQFPMKANLPFKSVLHWKKSFLKCTFSKFRPWLFQVSDGFPFLLSDW